MSTDIKTLTELIEFFSGPDTSADTLEDFAVELLKLVNRKSETRLKEDGCSDRHLLAEYKQEEIDSMIEELQPNWRDRSGN